MEAIGTVDELNSLIGVLVAMNMPSNIREILIQIQHTLFIIGADLATPNKSALSSEAAADLEIEIDRMDSELPALKRFILPGGSSEAAFCHNARSVCRRAERRVLALQQTDGDRSDQNALCYLNRLSDLLFVMARTLSRINGGEEIFWDNQ
jgi:cob(I)alamin adenosyltransferase